MENPSKLLLELAHTVENSLDDEQIIQRVTGLAEVAGIELASRSSMIPNKDTIAYNLRQLAEVANNMTDVELKAWPSGARHMLAKSLGGIVMLYSGI